jgi:CHC2 zinc finger/Toprim-like
VGEAARRSLLEVLDEEIVPRLGIEDVYGHVAFRTRRGRYWRGPCPLHGGDDPNFAVDTQTLAWSCFSHCGHGSVVGFINGGETPRGQRFVELVRELGERVGVTIDTLSPAELVQLEAERRRRQLLHDYVALAGRMLAEPPGGHIVRYLAERALPAVPDELARLGLGVHPGERSLEQELQVTRTELAAAGLLDSRWAGRLIIAWRDWRGRVATIAARKVRETDPTEKYLYLAGAARPALFGLDALVSHSSRPNEPVIVVEGLLDALSLRVHGFDRALALGGSLPSLRSFEEIELRGIGSVILALDADPSGEAGTRRFLVLARERAPSLVIRVIPSRAYLGAKDPAEIIATHGTPAMSAALAARLPAASYLADLILRGVRPDAPVGVRRDALTALERLGMHLEGPEREADLEDIVVMAVPRLGYTERTVRRALGAPDRPVEPPAADPVSTIAPLPLVAVAAGVARAVGVPLTPALMTHILRGSSGPRTREIVDAYGPPHVGELRDLTYAEVHGQVLEVWAGILAQAVGPTAAARPVAGRVAAKPVNQGQAWDPASLQELRDEWASGATVTEIAFRLGRTPNGVAARLVRLSLVGSRDEARRRGRGRASSPGPANRSGPPS